MTFNLLIRYSHRPELFKRCLESVKNQTYPCKIIFSVENNGAMNEILYAMEEIDFFPDFKTIDVIPDRSYEYFYNLYCNDLKKRVQDGWFMYLDTDDWLIHKRAIEDLVNRILEPYRAIVCQFRRNGRAKPKDSLMDSKTIRRGNIGLPSIVLHHSLKEIADFGGEGHSDYQFIKDVSEKTEILFLKQEVVATDRRSWGKN